MSSPPTKTPAASPAKPRAKGQNKGKGKGKEDPLQDDDDEDRVATDTEDPLPLTRSRTSRRGHLSGVLEEQGSSGTLQRAKEDVPRPGDGNAVAGSSTAASRDAASPEKEGNDVVSKRIIALLKKDETAHLVFVVCLGSRTRGRQDARIKAENQLRSSLEAGESIRDLMKKDIVIKPDDLLAIHAVPALGRFAPPPPASISKSKSKRKASQGKQNGSHDGDGEDAEDGPSGDEGPNRKARQKHSRPPSVVPYDEVAARLKDTGLVVKNDVPKFSSTAAWQLFAGALPHEHGLPPVVADTMIAAAAANAKLRSSVDRSGKLSVDAALCEVQMIAMREEMPLDRRAVFDELVRFVGHVRRHASESYTDGRGVVGIIDRHTNSLADARAAEKLAEEQAVVNAVDQVTDKDEATLAALIEGNNKDDGDKDGETADDAVAGAV